MRISAVFTPSEQDIHRLIDDHPLAQVVSASGAGLLATPLPLLRERSNGHSFLLGHFARANPHVAAIRQNPEALAVFMGPHGYVSPSWFSDRSQAPTWNFATVQMRVRVHLDESADAAAHAVDRLTAHMERGRRGAWQPRELGARYERMVAAIIAFRAEILDVRAKFKLGQNERADVLAETMEGLRGNDALCRIMRAANGAQPNAG